MRIVRTVLLVALAFAVVGCSCRARKVGGPDDGNIPVAAADGVLKDVNFGFDRYDLDATAKETLAKNAEWLNANTSYKVQVEGHCDERGTNEYNMVLGANRARAAHDYLRSLGVDASRMSTVSYGEELPLDPSRTEEAYAKNRRAHFNVQ